MAYQPVPFRMNAPADIIRSTFPAHDGHFFSGSSWNPWISSVTFPHFRHRYS